MSTLTIVLDQMLDHFLISPRLLPLVEDCGIIERGDNRSRHCPIWIKLKLGSLPLGKVSRKYIPRKPDWSRATEDHVSCYKDLLEEKLGQLAYRAPRSLTCGDLHCKEKSHSEMRDMYMIDILSAIIETSHLTIPISGGCWVGNKRPSLAIPGWSKEVKPHRNTSMYWGNIWRQAGRPSTGWVHQMYVDARKQYHQSILSVRRRRHELQAEELLTAAMQGDVQLIKEMKKIKKGKNVECEELPDTVDGTVGEQNIAELFKKTYDQLYNSSPSLVEMEELKTKLEKLIIPVAREKVDKVSGKIVREAVMKLKLRKTDVTGSYVSDAIRNAPTLLFDQLASIFKS